VVEFFRDDDPGYEAWLAANRGGYVVNVDELGSTGTRLHEANCRTLEKGAGGGSLRTSSYPKACSRNPAELDRWHRENYGTGLRALRCKTCDPSALTLS
jgi:hypothetical protein